MEHTNSLAELFSKLNFDYVASFRIQLEGTPTTRKNRLKLCGLVDA